MENILDYCTISGESVKKYEGRKRYVATGDVIENKIINSSEVDYMNKPSRANQIAKVGDLLFAKMKETKKVIKIDEDNSKNIYSTGFFVIRPNEGILTDYIYWVLNSPKFNRDKDRNCKGATQKALNNEGLKKIKINKIPDIVKQQKIVSKLNKINKIITKKKKQLNMLDELIKSQFVEMFGDIKVYKKLSDYSILITKGASPKWQGINYKRKGTLFITSENVREGYIDISKPKYLENKINEILPRSILRKEDILINIVGASIGRAAKYNYEYLANINQAVALVRTKNINNIFLLTYLNSEQAIKMYNDMKKGGARENLSLKNISDLKIPKATLALQNQFSEIVKQIDKQKFESMIQLKMMEKIYNIINDRRRYV